MRLAENAEILMTSNDTEKTDDIYDALRAAAQGLLDDVHNRYPDEELRCPHMIALEAALKEFKCI